MPWFIVFTISKVLFLPAVVSSLWHILLVIIKLVESLQQNQQYGRSESLRAFPVREKRQCMLMWTEWIDSSPLQVIGSLKKEKESIKISHSKYNRTCNTVPVRRRDWVKKRETDYLFCNGSIHMTLFWREKLYVLRAGMESMVRFTSADVLMVYLEELPSCRYEEQTEPWSVAKKSLTTSWIACVPSLVCTCTRSFWTSVPLHV